MLGKERFTGTKNDFLEKYPAHSDIGKLARQHDAKAMIAAIEKTEQEVEQRERANAQIENRIDRMVVEHQLNMDYLFTFGVRCENREELMRVLQEASHHGGISLQQAAALANARAVHIQNMTPDQTHNVNGLSGSVLS